MTEADKPNRYIFNRGRLPDLWPTHLHNPEFWEALGRAVATYGWLEEVLWKAIYVFGGTKPVPEQRLEAEYQIWRETVVRAMSDQLSTLIDRYAKAVRSNPSSTVQDLDHRIKTLKDAAALRNVICHGSWSHGPDENGGEIPLYVDRNGNQFTKSVDVGFLRHLQAGVAELGCDVMDSVTHMGWSFPGSGSPGRNIPGADEALIPR